MNAVKRHNLAQNAAFNSQRTADDRRAYRAIMRAFSKAEARVSGAAYGALNARHRAYLNDLLRHGNKAASFPGFAEWEASHSVVQ